MNDRRSLAATLALVLAAMLPVTGRSQAPQRVEGAAAPGPRFAVEPYWPKALPYRWILGQVSGIATDSRDHVWELHRPRSATADERGAAPTPPRSKCCIPVPAVIEFDREGYVLQA